MVRTVWRQIAGRHPAHSRPGKKKPTFLVAGETTTQKDIYGKLWKCGIFWKPKTLTTRFHLACSAGPNQQRGPCAKCQTGTAKKGMAKPLLCLSSYRAVVCNRTRSWSGRASRSRGHIVGATTPRWFSKLIFILKGTRFRRQISRWCHRWR